MKPFLILICLSLPVISFSQNRITDTSATCISFWQNKETKVYQVKHSKEKFDAQIRRSLSEGNYEVRLKIIDSTATGFTIEWIYKNFEISGAAENVLSSLFTIMEGLKIVYKTDDVGSFTELVNWEEVRDFAFASYEKAVAKNSQTREFIAALNQIKSIFQSKENIEAVLIKEIQLFHTPYGVEYTKTGNVIETELPNVTGGDPFPSTITMKLDELDIKKDLISISLNQTIDKEKAGPIIVEILKKISSTPIRDEAELKTQVKDMEISDRSEYTYAITSGWITRVYYKRTSNVGVVKAVETYFITQKK